MTIVDTKDISWHLLASKLRVTHSAIQLDTFDSSVKQSIPRDWLPIVFTEDKEPLPLKSDSKRSFDSADQYVNGWISRIREKLYSIPSVEDIFVSIEDTDVDVWVVIPNRDLSVLHQIVEREWELLKTLVSGESPPFLVDFHIIYRCGRNVEDLAPTRTIRLPRQVK